MTRVLTSSCKSKGRALQKIVRDALLEVSRGRGNGEANFDLESGDIVSTGMGQTGVDVVLSPAAKKVFGDIHIECKNQQSLNVTGIFFEHLAKYPNSPLPILVHKRNHTQPLVTIRMSDFLNLLSRYIRDK